MLAAAKDGPCAVSGTNEASVQTDVLQLLYTEILHFSHSYQKHHILPHQVFWSSNVALWDELLDISLSY